MWSNIIKGRDTLITLPFRLGMRIELDFGGKSGAEDWCLRMNFQCCIVSCPRELTGQQLGEHDGMRLLRSEV